MTKELMLQIIIDEINFHKVQCNTKTNQLCLYHNNKKSEQVNYYIMQLSQDLSNHYEKLELLEYLLNKFNPIIE